MFRRHVTSRRRMIGALATAAALPLAAAGSPSSLRAGQVGQAPAFYRLRLGRWTVTVLSDGNLIVPTPFYAVNAEPEAFRRLVEATAQPPERYPTQINIVLVEMDGRRLLFDVGSGGRFQDTAGHLAANLEAAGIAADSIDTVVISHAHPDHCWGLLDEFDEPAFPQAEVLIGSAEHAFWTDEGLPARLPETMQAMAAGAKRQLEGVADRIRTIAPGEEIVPGIRAVAAFGHTPGHLAFELQEGEATLFLSVDTFNHPVISLAHPEWHLGFDYDREQAAATRRQILARLAADRTLTLGYHMPWPGLGRVVPDGEGFRWIVEPLVWTL